MNKGVRSLALSIQNLFNEYPTAARGQASEFKSRSRYPIFIVGAPRTGSTLLYQLMVKQMKVAFISNAMALLPKCMLVVARYTRHWMHNIWDIKEADAGYVPGLFRPNEAGAIMRKWFEQAQPEERTLIRNTVIALSELLGAPFVNKNLVNSLRLPEIYAIFPEARFIHISRNPLFTAQSIILTRRSKLGDDRAWLGPEPPDCEDVKARSPVYQALWQVKRIEQTISGFFCRYSPCHIEIAYEELCQQPSEKLTWIANRFDLEVKADLRIAPLSIRETIELPEPEWDELAHCYAAIYDREVPKHG